MTARVRWVLLPVLVLTAASVHAAPDSTRTAPVAARAAVRAMKPDSAATRRGAKPDSSAMRHAASMKAPPARTVHAIPMPHLKLYPFDAVTLGVQHRVFHDFRDVHRVKLGEEFLLGDSDYSARVVQYLPDFQMDLASRRDDSLTDQPSNPAFRVVVKKGKAVQDTTWAFLNNPPHFGARSYFAFQVLKLELPGRAPMLPDTTSRLFKSGGRGPALRPAPVDSTRKP